MAPISLLLALLIVSVSVSASHLSTPTTTTTTTDLTSIDHLQFPSPATRVRDLSFNLDPVTHQRRVRPCAFFCAFRLCNFNGTTEIRPKAAFTILNAPRQANLPYVCRAGLDIGQVRGSLEARVNFRGNFVPISRWRPRGLTASYPANFIRTAKVPFLPWSGLSRAKTVGNQWDFLHNQCMLLPVKRYEIIDPVSEIPQRTVRTTNARSDCVAFRTTAATIQVEMVWDSGDDFDLSVVEPDGTVVDFNNPSSGAGKLNGDNNVGFCDTSLKYGKENILYFPGGPIKEGTYKVKAVHFKKCGTKPSVWRLRVIINGVIKLSRRGVANRGVLNTVASPSFSFSA